ncbi:aspartyl/glutamyl-tRNA amidotransferase subunit C [Myxococcota bacterium]|nr:aspartyl/glutamyl-tRNA amidotransferase subunit C [Myxococcota bacterium]
MTSPRLGADDVREIARLARLDLSDQEIAGFTERLASVLDYVSQIERAEVGAAAGPPEGQPRPWRPDAAVNPQGFDVADRLLAAAPARDGDLVVVPRVLDAE